MAMACTKAQEYGECGDCREVRMVLRGLKAGRFGLQVPWLSVSSECGWGARVSAKLTQGHISKVLNAIPKIWAVSCEDVCMCDGRVDMFTEEF